MLNYFTLNNLRTLIQQLLDIACVWALVYYCLKIVKNNSRTIQIFKGILLIVIIRSAASFFGLHTVATLADSIMNWGVVAVIIIFQPEIRSILERIGKTNVFSRISTLTINERENLVDELVKACAEMSKTKTGALISIEQGHSLSDYIKTGTPMNSVVSSELLCSIFQYGTPLHDGAVIIQGVKIACAAAYFPPTTRELPTSYGARHRAAVGISEITDSITIVVSEETGNISIAEGGKLTVISEASLREFLMNVVCKQQSGSVHEKQEEPVEQERVPMSADGKKPGVFAHYFKGKNKRVKKETADNRYTKKKKDEDHGKKDKEVVVVEQEVDRLHIEDLTQKQDEKLDALFENIVTDTEKKEEPEADTEKPKAKKRKTTAKKKTAAAKEVPIPEAEDEKPVKKARRKTKKETKTEEAAPKKKSSTIMTNMANDLFDDVIEPEAIVLHYEKADDEDTPEKDHERRDS